MRHHHHFHQTIIAAIRTRAYEIWESEGRPDGHSVDHWLQAEMEINSDEDSEDEDDGKPQRFANLGFRWCLASSHQFKPRRCRSMAW